MIRDLVFQDVKINTAAAMAGGDFATTKLSEIHLKNLGEKQNGVDTAQAVIIVLSEIYSQVISVNALGELKDQLKGLEKKLSGVREEVKSVGSQFKGLLEE